MTTPDALPLSGSSENLAHDNAPLHIRQFDKNEEFRSAVRRINEIIDADRSKLKITFAGGVPPAELSASVARRLLGLRMEQEEFEKLTTYGATAGAEKFRRAVPLILADRGFENLDWIEVIADGGGSTHAIETVASRFLDDGDFALVSGPTFSGTAAALWQRHPTFVQLEMDEYGTKPQQLRSALEMATQEAKKARSRGKEPKKVLWYDMFNGHNPTGITVPMQRRHEYLQILEEYSKPEKLGDLLTVAEDDAYFECFYGDENPPTLTALARREYPNASQNMIYIASFSKSLDPYERLAMIVTSPRTYGKILGREEASMLFGPLLTQAAVADFITEHQYEAHVRSKVRPRYKAGRDAMASALTTYKDACGWEFTVPVHGMFISLKLPEGIDADDFAQKLYDEEGIAVLSDKDFYVIKDARPATQALRLCFVTETPEKVKEGVEIMAKFLQEYKRGK